MLAGSSRLWLLAPYSICVTTKFITHSQTFVTDWRRQRRTWQDGGVSWGRGYSWGWGCGSGICMSARTYVQLSKLFIFSSLSFFCWHLFTCVAINFLLRRVANWRRRVICAPAVDAVRPLAAGRWHTPAQVSAYLRECVCVCGLGVWAGHREVWLNVIWCEFPNFSQSFSFFAGLCVIYVNFTICVAYFTAVCEFPAKWKFQKLGKLNKFSGMRIEVNCTTFQIYSQSYLTIST